MDSGITAGIAGHWPGVHHIAGGHIGDKMHVPAYQKARAQVQMVSQRPRGA